MEDTFSVTFILSWEHLLRKLREPEKATVKLCTEEQPGVECSKTCLLSSEEKSFCIVTYANNSLLIIL